MLHRPVGTTVGIRGASGDGDDAIGVADVVSGGGVDGGIGVEVVRDPLRPTVVVVADGKGDEGAQRNVFTGTQ